MANVKFLQGTHEQLNKTGFKAEDGAFYITTDTHKIFLGKSNGTAQELASDIIIIDNSTTVSGNYKIGQLFFNKDTNLLYINKGGQNLTPLNYFENSNSITTMNGGTITVTPTATKDAISISATIKQIITDSTSGDPSETEVNFAAGTLTKSDLNSVLGFKVGINSSLADNAITLSTQGEGADTSTTKPTAVIKGGNNITIQADGNNTYKINGPTPLKNNAVNVSVENNGTNPKKLKVSVTDSNGDAPYGETDQIYYKIDNKTYGIQSDLKDAINELINADRKKLNALTYKGVVTADSYVTELGKNQISNGDVYLVSGTIALDETRIAENGDLLIAQGSENETTGFIENNLSWDLVPSGDEVDTQYVVSADGTKMTISETTGSGDPIGSYEIKGNYQNPVSVVPAEGGDAKNASVLITHKAQTAATNSNTINNSVPTKISSTTSATVIQDVELDGYGHISKITYGKYSIQDEDTKYKLSQATSLANNNNNDILTHNVTLTNLVSTDVETAALKLSSSSLTFSKTAGDTTNTAYDINLTWGTF